MTVKRRLRQMAQHFLLSSAAKSLTLGQVIRLSDGQVEETFMRLRWADNDGQAYCPACGSTDCYQSRRRGARRWQCKACHKDFSLTSGTIFANHKMPLRSYLMAVAVFCNEVKGKSMLALSRDLGTAYKTSFVLAHKIRESMATEVNRAAIGGAGKRAEIDGAYFGGYVKPANRKENRVDRRKAENRTGKRQVVVVIRERNGNTLPGVFKSEAAALDFIRAKVAKETTLYADEAGSWNDLHARYTMHRINHQEAYAMPGGVWTNAAEGYFSRLRRAEIGHHHHIAGPYLLRFAQEAAWREDHRRDPNGSQVDRVVTLAMKAKPSWEFAGYWQRHIREAAE
jgi:transposase-like protein